MVLEHPSRAPTATEQTRPYPHPRRPTLPDVFSEHGEIVSHLDIFSAHGDASHSDVFSQHGDASHLDISRRTATRPTPSSPSTATPSGTGDVLLARLHARAGPRHLLRARRRCPLPRHPRRTATRLTRTSSRGRIFSAHGDASHSDIFSEHGEVSHSDVFSLHGDASHLDIFSEHGEASHIDIFSEHGEASHIDLFSEHGEASHDTTFSDGIE